MIASSLIGFTLMFSVIGQVVPGERLLQLADERERITSGEVEIRAKILTRKALPELLDAEWTIHYWFNEDGSYRLDRHLKQPHDADHRDHRDNASHEGDVYRMISPKDSAVYPVGEYHDKPPYPLEEIIDPRVFGLDTSPIEIFHHASFRQFRELLTGATRLEQGRENGREFEAIKRKNGVSLKVFINEAGLPIEFILWSQQAKGPWNRKVRIDYDSTNPAAERLPSRIELKEIENEQITLHERIEIDWIKVNKPFDKTLCSWASMEPLRGSRLDINGRYDKNYILYWDGSEFVPPDQLEKRSKGDRMAWHPVFWISTGSGILCLGVLLYRAVGPRGANIA